MSKYKGIIDDKLEVIIKEFQGIVSFGYIILIVLGMIFESIYYAQFGINIFNYSGILDFLLVPFRRPIVLGILMGVYLFIYLYFFVLNKFLLKKTPKFHNKLFGTNTTNGHYLKSNVIRLLLFYLVITISWAFVISKKNKETLFENKMNVEIQYDIEGTKVIAGKLIGKNDINIFLLDISNKVQIIPVNSNIIKIKPLK